jgi:hypothetical protein
MIPGQAYFGAYTNYGSLEFSIFTYDDSSISTSIDQNVDPSGDTTPADMQFM